MNCVVKISAAAIEEVLLKCNLVNSSGSGLTNNALARRLVLRARSSSEESSSSSSEFLCLAPGRLRVAMSLFLLENLSTTSGLEPLREFTLLVTESGGDSDWLSGARIPAFFKYGVKPTFSSSEFASWISTIFLLVSFFVFLGVSSSEFVVVFSDCFPLFASIFLNIPIIVSSLLSILPTLLLILLTSFSREFTLLSKVLSSFCSSATFATASISWSDIQNIRLANESIIIPSRKIGKTSLCPTVATSKDINII